VIFGGKFIGGGIVKTKLLFERNTIYAKAQIEIIAGEKTVRNGYGVSVNAPDHQYDFKGRGGDMFHFVAVDGEPAYIAEDPGDLLDDFWDLLCRVADNVGDTIWYDGLTTGHERFLDIVHDHAPDRVRKYEDKLRSEVDG